MGRIALSSLRPGMTLGAPVMGRRRQILAEAGEVVDARRLRIFQAWGVMSVEVIGSSEPTLAEVEREIAAARLSNSRLAERCRDIDLRFDGAGASEFVVELKRIAKRLALEESGG